MLFLSGSQWTALSIFVLSYALIISNKVHRALAAFIGAVLASVFVLPLNKLASYESWETLSFVFGMMAVVSLLQLAGCFRWLGLRAARWIRLDPLRLYWWLPLAVGILSAFAGSLTVMLFVTTLTLELAELIEIDPFPLLLSEIAASNIGGAATLAGNPPNIILAAFAHQTFLHFSYNTAVPSALALVLNTALFIAINRKPIFLRRQQLAAHPSVLEAAMVRLHSRDAARDMRLFISGVAIFIFVIGLLVTQSMTGLTVGYAALIGAGLTLAVAGSLGMARKILEAVDWASLIFFASLFLLVGALEETGLLRVLAGGILTVTGAHPALMLSVILWFSALASALIDNVPMAATMAPLLGHLSAAGRLSLPPLVWAAVLGTDIGGNGTPIGASANVVALSAYENQVHRRVGWGEYCRTSFTVMVVVVGVINLYLIMVYHP